jgi:hypothetical protein
MHLYDSKARAATLCSDPSCNKQWAGDCMVDATQELCNTSESGCQTSRAILASNCCHIQYDVGGSGEVVKSRLMV